MVMDICVFEIFYLTKYLKIHFH